MPVKRRTPVEPDLTPYGELIDQLASELTAQRPFGQPLVEEEELERNGLIAVTVVWDALRAVPEVLRPAVIQQAYRQANSPDAERLAYSVGYTTREAVEAGLLPFTVELSNLPGSFGAVIDLQALLRKLGASEYTDADGLVVIPCRTLDAAVHYRDAILQLAPSDAARDAVRICDQTSRARY